MYPAHIDTRRPAVVQYSTLPVYPKCGPKIFVEETHMQTFCILASLIMHLVCKGLYKRSSSAIPALFQCRRQGRMRPHQRNKQHEEKQREKAKPCPNKLDAAIFTSAQVLFTR